MDPGVASARRLMHLQQQLAAEKVGALRTEEDAQPAVRRSVPPVVQPQVGLQLVSAKSWIERVQLTGGINALLCFANRDSHGTAHADLLEQCADGVHRPAE